eukprot:bmy_15547T0
MEAATALEVASGSTPRVKEASLADADGAQASPRRGAVSPIPQLLPPTEGDPWGWGASGRLTTPCSLSFHHSEHPKIWLPQALRQTYVRKVGDTLNLLIPFQVIMPAPR